MLEEEKCVCLACNELVYFIAMKCECVNEEESLVCFRRNVCLCNM